MSVMTVGPQVETTPVDVTGASVEDAAWRSQASRLARGAELAVMLIPGVAAAQVEISGTRTEPDITALFELTAGTEPSHRMDAVTRTVVTDLESILGVEFAARQISFTVEHARSEEREATLAGASGQ